MLSDSGLLSEARQIAGLQDYGNMAFAEGLGVLAKSINEEAALTPDHEALFKNELLRLLVNRLRMQRDLVQHPEILDEQILPPVYITSMPRTGSTKLHRLMAATGDFNYLRYWQQYHFAPFPDSASVTPDPRIAAAEAHLQWEYAKSPEFHITHPMYTEEAEEEILLLDAGFNSLYLHVALVNVPSYAQWVLSRDGLEAYRDLRRMLQYLQWQHYRGRNKRWVLKTPSTFGVEGDFAKVFGGTDFIVSHRHPEQFIASAARQFRAVRRLYSDVDYSSIAGEGMLYNFAEMLKGHLQWRDNYPAHKVIDVRFQDVIKDELKLLQNIYDFLGMEFTQQSKDNVLAWIAMDAKREHKRTPLSLSDFNLTPEAVSERLRDYIQRYAAFM